MEPKEASKKTPNGGAKPTPPPIAAPVGAAASSFACDDTEFAPTYPVLVEHIAPAGPGGIMTSQGRGASGATSDVGATVHNVLRDVLGWQPRAGDAKGFLGALTQSFDLLHVEGHVEAKHRERRFAVQSDLAGGISGAQASLLTRARHAVEEAQPLLEALYDLSNDADPEVVDALRSIVSEQLDELVNELATMGGPRVMRVDQIFELLLGSEAFEEGESQDPDLIDGHLGELRTALGLSETELVNTVEEEQNITNYRILADYVIGLRRSWDDNREHFSRKPSDKGKFLGTQLVLLSRQLAVVAESVAELRTIFDSVFIGQLERQTLEIVPFKEYPSNHKPQKLGEADGFKYNSSVHGEPFFLEELLSWIESFATREGPRLIESGGKLGILKAFLPTVGIIEERLLGAREPANYFFLPDGYKTTRVRRGFTELDKHLDALIRLASPPTSDESTFKRGAAPNK